MQEGLPCIASPYKPTKASRTIYNRSKKLSQYLQYLSGGDPATSDRILRKLNMFEGKMDTDTAINRHSQAIQQQIRDINSSRHRHDRFLAMSVVKYMSTRTQQSVRDALQYSSVEYVNFIVDDELLIQKHKTKDTIDLLNGDISSVGASPSRYALSRAKQRFSAYMAENDVAFVSDPHPEYYGCSRGFTSTLRFTLKFFATLPRFETLLPELHEAHYTTRGRRYPNTVFETKSVVSLTIDSADTSNPPYSKCLVSFRNHIFVQTSSQSRNMTHILSYNSFYKDTSNYMREKCEVITSEAAVVAETGVVIEFESFTWNHFISFGWVCDTPALNSLKFVSGSSSEFCFSRIELFNLYVDGESRSFLGRSEIVHLLQYYRHIYTPG